MIKLLGLFTFHFFCSPAFGAGIFSLQKASNGLQGELKRLLGTQLKIWAWKQDSSSSVW
jgi:hypothetical protein